MKINSLIATLTITTGFVTSVFLADKVEARQSISSQASQPKHWTQDERQILQRYCSQISSRIMQQAAAQGGGWSSGYDAAIRQEITNYLLSVGTPTALQMIREYEANGFRGFVRY